MSTASGSNQGFAGSRVVSDLEAAYVELLSAACAIGRVRNRHSFVDIARYCEPRLVTATIRTADAIHEYMSELKSHVGQD